MTSVPMIKKINKKNYYSADELMEYSSSFFKGCKNSRAIISKKDLAADDYIYAAKKDDKWVETDGSSRKFDRPFISKEWIEENMPEFNDGKNAIETAPDIIELKKINKFRDGNGKIVEMEIRGEREYDKCFFKARDIMEGFGLTLSPSRRLIARSDLKHLQTIVDNKKNGYQENMHYVYFNIQKLANKKRPALFLTYTGLLRILFAFDKIDLSINLARVPRCKNNADKFIKWASETLFSAQTETKQKKILTKILGATPDTIKSIFNKSSTKLACIYLFNLGKVKDLRDILDIDNEYDDNDNVYKYGNTDDLASTAVENKREFAKIGISNIHLSLFGFIDNQYNSNAETHVKKFINTMNWNLDNETYEEIAVIPKKKFQLVKKQYETISKAYMIYITEIINKMKGMQQELLQSTHKNEILEKNYQLLQKEMEINSLKKANQKNH